MTAHVRKPKGAPGSTGGQFAAMKRSRAEVGVSWVEAVDTFIHDSKIHLLPGAEVQCRTFGSLTVIDADFPTTGETNEDGSETVRLLPYRFGLSDTSSTSVQRRPTLNTTFESLGGMLTDDLQLRLSTETPDPYSFETLVHSGVLKPPTKEQVRYAYDATERNEAQVDAFLAEPDTQQRIQQSAEQSPSGTLGADPRWQKAAMKAIFAATNMEPQMELTSGERAGWEEAQLNFKTAQVYQQPFNHLAWLCKRDADHMRVQSHRSSNEAHAERVRGWAAWSLHAAAWFQRANDDFRNERDGLQ